MCVWEGEKASVAIHCMNKTIEIKESCCIVSRNKGKMDSVHMITRFIVRELQGIVSHRAKKTLFASSQWI